MDDYEQDWLENYSQDKKVPELPEGEFYGLSKDQVQLILRNFWRAYPRLARSLVEKA